MIVKRNLMTKVAILAIAALMIGAFVVTVPMSTEASFSGEGAGTVGDPYIISSVAQLQEMNDDLSAHYKLGTMIYFEDETFTPIGDSTTPFTGSLNGDGFWILNMTIDSTSSSVGLFGYTGPGASITKLGVEMASVTSTGTNVGALVGYNKGNISQCFVTGAVTGENRVGGLVGSNEGLISDSYSTAEVTGNSTVGGLVGWNNGGEVNRTYAAGAVEGNTHVGGLVGYDNGGNVDNSYYDSQTTGQSDAGKGIAKTTAEMRNQTTFVDWDFDNVWRINDGVSYPRLQALFTLDDIEEFIQQLLDEVCNSAGVILLIGGVAIVSSRRKKV